MDLKKTVAAFGLATTMLGTMGLGLVSAAPTNAPSASIETFTCANGDTVTVVTNGQGNFTPGHVISINDTATHATYIPLAFSGTFIPDQPFDGPTDITVPFGAKPGNRNGVTNTITCSTAPEYLAAGDPNNPFPVGGYATFNVTAFEAGNSH